MPYRKPTFSNRTTPVSDKFPERPRDYPGRARPRAVAGQASHAKNAQERARTRKNCAFTGLSHRRHSHAGLKTGGFPYPGRLGHGFQSINGRLVGFRHSNRVDAMLIVCPSCTTSYLIDPASVGSAGRTVRCARCKTTWFAGAPKPAPEVSAFVDSVIAEAEAQSGESRPAAAGPKPAEPAPSRDEP